MHADVYSGIGGMHRALLILVSQSCRWLAQPCLLAGKCQRRGSLSAESVPQTEQVNWLGR